MMYPDVKNTNERGRGMIPVQAQSNPVCCPNWARNGQAGLVCSNPVRAPAGLTIWEWCHNDPNVIQALKPRNLRLLGSQRVGAGVEVSKKKFLQRGLGRKNLAGITDEAEIRDPKVGKS